MATIQSTPYTLSAAKPSFPTRDLTEVTLGFAAILGILWLPTREQLIVGPIVLLMPLVLVLVRPRSLYELGLSWRAIAPSFWMLPAAAALSIVGVFAARAFGTFHPLFHGDLAHSGGYILWTIYQQFLLQDYFMPRLTRLLSSDAAVLGAGTLFAVAHLPNIPLAIATLAWGVVSCALFRRYRSLWILGVTQGLLGLSFAVCVPDAMLHHMRVGLGYLDYHPLQGSFH